MSKTDKTRPWDIQARDKMILRVTRVDRDQTGRPIGVSLVPLHPGGANYADGHGKEYRQRDTRQRRRRDTNVCHHALRGDYDYDTLPVRGDRKSLGWLD